MERMQGEGAIRTGHPTWEGALGRYARTTPVVVVCVLLIDVIRRRATVHAVTTRLPRPCLDGCRPTGI